MLSVWCEKDFKRIQGVELHLFKTPTGYIRVFFSVTRRRKTMRFLNDRFNSWCKKRCSLLWEMVLIEILQLSDLIKQVSE